MSSGFLPPSRPAAATVTNGAGILPFLIDPHLRIAMNQNWMLGVQHQLGLSVLVEINYVASKGTRLLRVIDGNAPKPALVAQLEAFCVPNNPANQGFRTPTGQCDQSTLQFGNLWFGAESGFLPFDAVNNNAFFHTDSFAGVAASIYHALQANVTKRMAQGMSFQAAYTWGHAITNSSHPLVPTQGGQPFPRNSFNLRAGRGNSDFDVRQRLAINYVWALPVGRGHAHLSENSIGKILEGWQIAGITTFATGLPFDIFTDTDTPHTRFIPRPEYHPSPTPIPVPHAPCPPY